VRERTSSNVRCRYTPTRARSHSVVRGEVPGSELEPYSASRHNHASGSKRTTRTLRSLVVPTFRNYL
jgi:hypothetical protein